MSPPTPHSCPPLCPPGREQAPERGRKGTRRLLLVPGIVPALSPLSLTPSLKVSYIVTGQFVQHRDMGVGGLPLANLELMTIRDADQCPSPHLLDFEGWLMNGWKRWLRSAWAQGRARRGQLESVPQRELKSAPCAPSLQSPQAEPLSNQPSGAPTARSRLPLAPAWFLSLPSRTPCLCG